MTVSSAKNKAFSKRRALSAAILVMLVGVAVSCSGSDTAPRNKQ